jgi:amidohydrolase
MPWDLAEPMTELSLALHADPETRFEEHRAAHRITAWLAAEGFSIRQPAGGLDTAFVATHQGTQNGPTIAVLLEYDALPGIGHGCGHNLIAAGGAAAAVAAARRGHQGCLKVIGTPGEEGGGGKVILLDRGVFDDVEAAVMFHPSDRDVAARHSLAAAHLKITFTGRAAHAASSPEHGRSALGAAQLFFHAIDIMRQFVPSTARLHGIITDGGQAPNVVPERAEAIMYVRDLTEASVDELTARVHDAAQGAAMATGTTAEIGHTAPRYAARRNNMTIANRLAVIARQYGIDLAPPSPDNPAGSSDIGNVSARIPAIHPYLRICDPGTPGHSVEFREAAGTEGAHLATASMAQALAALVTELLAPGGALLAAAKSEFAGP